LVAHNFGKREFGWMNNVVDDHRCCGNLGFPLHRETWGCQFNKKLGFPVGMKLRVSKKLSFHGSTSSGGELEITYFMDVVRDDNDLRWGRM
jgi:hypothetical protein